jgi:hypothetical protein
MLNDEWLTPRWILDQLDDFDLDPCAPVKRPWEIAKKHYTKEDDGLSLPWEGRVWCNPPYGLIAARWLQKCYKHGNATALIFARTETKMFFDHVWPKCDGLLFIKNRLYFYDVNGRKGKANSGAPSVLVAYGENNAKILRESSIPGAYIDKIMLKGMKREPVDKLWE